LAVVVVFLLIFALAFTNEDGIQTEAVSRILLMALAICGAVAAWRWERVGGAALVLSAVALAASMCQGYSTFGLVGLFLVLLIYTPLPLLSGVLFLLSSRRGWPRFKPNRDILP
jgi:hypothetical protein